jgi:coenzyme F420-0:L-glutamate ligase / coenzyme F420-1:gamma-L-glutamate ligase
VARLTAYALVGLPEVRVGDDLAGLIAAVLGGEPLRDGQVVAIAHKAVSKAEGAIVALASVRPGARALELAVGPLAPADGTERDPRVVQVVLDQSAEIMRAERGVLICRTKHGFVCANAGVDASNAPPPSAFPDGVSSPVSATEDDPQTLVVLPRDPDVSARELRARLRELTGASPAVLITDSFGRAWRHGQCDVALGCAGMAPLEDWRGRSDAAGMELRATWLAVADAAAAAADLARAKDSGEPVVVIDGLERFVTVEDGPGAAALIRPPEEDLFR